MNTYNDLFYFLKHLNNLEIDDTAPWSIMGTDSARIFKDKSTDSFVEIIFDNIDKLNSFIDYTYYEIYSKIYRIHDLAKNNGFYLDESEYIKVIFKGGNVMSYYYDKIITDRILTNDGVSNFPLSELINYYTAHQINIPDNCRNHAHQGETADKTIRRFFNDNKKKFKLSDVDFTMYLNISNPIRYSIFAQLYGQILIHSLTNIKDFFNTYYESIRNDNNISQEIQDIIYNRQSFIPNDTENDFIIKQLCKRINIIKKENNKIFINPNEVHNLDIRINFLKFQNIIFNNYIIEASDINNYDNILPGMLYFDQIRNIRIIVYINEYFELFKIYMTNYKNTLNIVDPDNVIIDNFLIDVETNLIMSRQVLLLHIDNKKKRVLESNIYTLDKINLLMNNISEKYGPNDLDHEQLYRDKYISGFDKKNIHDKIKLMKDPPSILTFHNYVTNQNSNPDNEINISSRNNTLIYAVNNLDITDIRNINTGDINYHYITYNNSICSDNYTKSSSFDLYRIKINIIVDKPIFAEKDVLIDKFNIPSEFIDVSIPNYTDSSRKMYYNEIQEKHNIMNILSSSSLGTTYYWDSYSIEQLIVDLMFILFLQKSCIPWYDHKYDKRITRVLILYCLNKIIDPTLVTNNWLCALTDFLIFSCEMYTYSNFPLPIIQGPIVQVPVYPDINKFILGRDYLQRYSIAEGTCISKYVLNNSIKKIKEIDYSDIILINDNYNDFGLILKFIIFYGYIMKHPNFFDIFNDIRKNGGIKKYTDINQTILLPDGLRIPVFNNNNNKFRILLETIINILSVIIFTMNELIPICRTGNLQTCQPIIIGGLKNKKYKIIKMKK